MSEERQITVKKADESSGELKMDKLSTVTTNLGEEVPLLTNCISCGMMPMYFIMVTLDLPYFGEVVQSTLFCKYCGFRTADIIITQQKEPTRYIFEIESSEDMMVRVIRSTSGTIHIPEIGVLVEPGPASESFVSNIEGVLVRIKEVVQMSYDFAETDEQREKASNLLETIDKIIAGEAKATVILEDPYGNSAILSERAKVCKLTEDEAKGLKTGMITFEIESAKDEAKGEQK